MYIKNKEDLSSFKLYIDKKKKLQFICLDASIGFKTILDFNPKSIILASGTLSPFEIVEKQLDNDFDFKLSINPDLEKWKKKLAVVKISNFFNFHNKKQISLNFNTRGDESIMRAFLELLAKISVVVPEGILIFFPSYQT